MGQPQPHGSSSQLEEDTNTSNPINISNSGFHEEGRNTTHFHSSNSSFPGPTPGVMSPLTDQVRELFPQDVEREEEELIPTTLKWTHNGNTVFLAGSFNDWVLLPMTRDPAEGVFVLLVDLRPGDHLFQFLVDNEWRYDPNLPTVIDENNIVRNKITVSPREPLSDTEFASEDEEIDANLPYSTEEPPGEDFIKDPPTIPPHFADIVLNTDIKQIDPYLLPKPQHVTVNHTYISNRPNSSDIMVLGITQRHKTKFVTTVYYKPVS